MEKIKILISKEFDYIDMLANIKILYIGTEKYNKSPFKDDYLKKLDRIFNLIKTVEVEK